MTQEFLFENGIVTEEEFAEHEMELCQIFDANWFQCDWCAWTMPLEEQGDRDWGGDRVCKDCEENYEAY
jgi:hypothetical protein